MLTKKEIFVLTGAGHKGSVKITPVENSKNEVEIECNLDFRPSGATLYVIGDEIAQLTLNNNKFKDKVRFVSNNVHGCIVRSSAFTMFGGRGNKSEMLSKIDAQKRPKLPIGQAQNAVPFHTNSIKNVDKKSQEITINNGAQNATSNLAKLLSETSTDDGILKYNGSNFYLAIKPQLDEMFVCYKQDETLNNTVANSSWVHIDTDDGYYVVGILKDGDSPSYICYGVPSKDKNDVPPELKDVCVWLPVEDENIKGYWVIYQSAVNGDIVK